MFQSINLPIISEKISIPQQHMVCLRRQTTNAGKALAGLIHYVQAHQYENQRILFWNTYGQA
jgi:hypothetical protein